MIEQVWAMGSQPSQQGGGAGLLGFLPFIVIILILWFFMLRPQAKKQKEHQKMVSELKKGDRVVTNSGILGTVVGFGEKDNIIVLKIADETKIEMLKSSVAGRIEKAGE